MGTGIARRERILDGAESSAPAKVEYPDQITAQMVAQASAEGDRLTAEIWEETVAYLSPGLGNIIVTLEPEAIISGGGGVAMTGEQLLRPLRERISNQIKILPASNVKILRAGLEAESGIYGAPALASTAKQICENNKIPRCLVPKCDGADLS